MSLPFPPAPPPSDDARALAQRLFARSVAGDGVAIAPAAAAEHAIGRICTALSRWFGPFGAQALMLRALARARALHPVLDSVTLAQEGPVLVGLPVIAERHGGEALADGIVTLVAVLAELLNRLIGAELTERLLEQGTDIAIAGPRNTEPAPPPPPRDAAPPGTRPPDHTATSRDLPPHGPQTKDDK